MTIKKTTVYISIGDKTEVFRSPDEIPDGLKSQLARSTRGMNSATILIADRGGREEIRKILAGKPSALKSRLRGDYFRGAVATKEPTQEIVGAGKDHGLVEHELLECELVEDRGRWHWRNWSADGWKRANQQWQRLGWKDWVELLVPGAVGAALGLILTWGK